MEKINGGEEAINWANEILESKEVKEELYNSYKENILYGDMWECVRPVLNTKTKNIIVTCTRGEI